jgi:SAM-dependent methyltransferase
MLQSILAKNEFDKYRNAKKVYFDYKYHVTDACLKYLYILQRIENYVNFLGKNRDISILEVGCGNGHLLKIISNQYNVNCLGFDPILKDIRVKLLKFKRDRFRNQKYKLIAKDHMSFAKNNRNKFDIIYDACALTHFDTTKSGEINLGWKWALDYFPSIIKSNGVFICATDTSEISPSNEFLASKAILNSFERIGKINNINLIEFDSKLGTTSQKELIAYNDPFIRIASAYNPMLLNVLGFEVEFN